MHSLLKQVPRAIRPFALVRGMSRVPVILPGIAFLLSFPFSPFLLSLRRHVLQSAWGGHWRVCSLGSANAGPLVDTEFVAQNAGRLKILDASWHMPATGRDPKKEFIQGRIPGTSDLAPPARTNLHHD